MNDESKTKTGKRKRGRPKTNGVKSGNLLWRDLLVLHTFNRLRPNMKHSCAVSETVMAIRKDYPNIHLSETEVRRILAEFQPRNSPIAVSVGKKPQDQVNFEFENLPDELKEFLRNKPPVNVFPFGFGPRPRYSR